MLMIWHYHHKLRLQRSVQSINNVEFKYFEMWCVQNILFENFYLQAGMDASGVPTDMLTLNSTVKIFYRNPATFFGVHVTSTPLELHYFDLKVASGHVSFTHVSSLLASFLYFRLVFYYITSMFVHMTCVGKMKHDRVHVDYCIVSSYRY